MGTAQVPRSPWAPPPVVPSWSWLPTPSRRGQSHVCSLISAQGTARTQAGTAWPGLGGAAVGAGTLSQGGWGPLALPVPSFCHHWAPRGRAQPGPSTELSWTQPWYNCTLYFQSMLGNPSPSVPGAGSAAHGTALLCPQSPSGSQPRARDVPPVQEGLPLHPPLRCCSDVSPGVRWDAGNAQLRGHLPRLPAPAPPLPQPLWAHRQRRGILGTWVHRLAPRLASRPSTSPRGKAGAGLLSPLHGPAWRHKPSAIYQG